jgi:hypothetical protein
MTRSSSNSYGILANPKTNCPPEVLRQQIALNIEFFGFDERIHSGTIEVNKSVAQDVADFFVLALRLKFPMQEVTPASKPPYKWDDSKLMAANVTSGFNYRTVAGTNKISLHGQGLAFDVNPVQNPFVRYGSDGNATVEPSGATWDSKSPGTLYDGHELVEFLLMRGWQWGGHWQPNSGRIDYQHFQKT